MKIVHTAGTNIREQTLLEREIQLLRDLKKYDHKNIVKYVDFFHYKNFPCIIMEYCERGTLYEFIRDQKNKVVQEDKFVHILTQIAAGLEVGIRIKLVFFFYIQTTNKIRKTLHRDTT